MLVDFLKSNIPWIFSGVGVTAIAGVFAVIRRLSRKRKKENVFSQTQRAGAKSIQYQAGRDINLSVPPVSEQPAIEVKTHRAFFHGSQVPYYFVNVVSLMHSSDVELTHVWYEGSAREDIVEPSRRLPYRLRPSQSWEVWILENALPADQETFENFRVRVSTGEIFKSRANPNVQAGGFVPGS